MIPEQLCIHGTAAVSLGIKSDVFEAAGANTGGDAIEHVEREGAGEFGAVDFDAGKLAVVADAELDEAELMEVLLGEFDLAQGIRSYGTAIFNTRGKAGGGRLVPEGEAALLGEGSDGLLAETGESERREHMVPLGGALPGAEVAVIIKIAAIGNFGGGEFEGDGLHDTKEFVFAVEAAGSVIAGVVFRLQL